MKREKYRRYNYIENENKISIKLKKVKVARYFIEYRKIKNKLEFYDIVFDNTEKEKLIKYIQYIDKVIQLMSKDCKEFIINEYIKHYNETTWWVNTYNRSTYYKIRKASLDEFLKYVE